MDQETLEMLNEMEKESSKKNKTFWVPKEGENIIRFLPPLKPIGETIPYFHHRVHWIDGNPYECLDQSFLDKNGNLHKPESCPACKMSKKLYKISENGSEERDLALSLSAKDRYIFRIIDRSKDEAQIEFYEVGPAIFKKFFNILKSGKYGNIVHPIEGRDFIIDKQGSGRRTSYDGSIPDANKSPIFESKDKIKEILSIAVNMKYTDLIEFTPREKIELALKEFLDPESNDVKKSSNESSRSVEKGNRDEDESSTIKNVESAKNEESADDDQIDALLNEFI